MILLDETKEHLSAISAVDVNLVILQMFWSFILNRFFSVKMYLAFSLLMYEIDNSDSNF